MKKGIFLIFRLSIIIMLGLQIFSDINAQELKRYEFETAYAEKISTTNSSGVEVTRTETIYVSDFGNKEIHFINEKRKINMMGQNINEENNTVSIIDGDWIISYDTDKKTGTKIKLNMNENLSGLSEGNLKKMAEQMGDAMNTEITGLGTEDLNGKSCKVTQAVTDLMGMKTTSKTWTYKNFVMKSESSGMGSDISETVTKFQEGVTVDPKMFNIPSDIEIKEVKSPY